MAHEKEKQYVANLRRSVTNLSKAVQQVYDGSQKLLKEKFGISWDAQMEQTTVLSQLIGTLTGVLERYTDAYSDLMKYRPTGEEGDTEQWTKYINSFEEIDEKVKVQLDILTKRYDHWTANMVNIAPRDGPEWESVKQQQKQLEIQEKQLELQEKQFEWEKAEKEKPEDVKLPKLDIPKFNGNFLHFRTWWESFDSSVHSRPHMSNRAKFEYLRMYTTGDAELAIKGYKLTGDNYLTCIDLIKERFGKNDFIISAHYDALSKIPPCIDNTQFRPKYVEIETHLHSLEAMGEDVNNGVILVQIMKIFPASVISYLEDKKDPKESWTVKSFRDAIKQYCTSREYGAHRGHTESQDNLLSSAFNTSVHLDEPRSSAQALFTTDRPQYHGAAKNANSRTFNRKDYRKCRFCGSEHFPSECRKYKTVEDRRKQLELKKACIICLGSHKKEKCRSTKPCFYCKLEGSHHSSLCRKEFPSKQKTKSEHAAVAVSHQSCQHITGCSPINQASDTMESVSRPSPSSSPAKLAANHSHVLMKTATATLVNCDTVPAKRIKARIVLDSACGRTYITSQLANRLNLNIQGDEKLNILTFGAQTPQEMDTKRTSLSLILKDSSLMQLDVNVADHVCGNIHRCALDESEISRVISPGDLADSLPTTDEISSVSMIIGLDYYDLLFPEIRINKRLRDNLHLENSKLGWILSGTMKSQKPAKTPVMIEQLFQLFTLDAPVSIMQPTPARMPSISDLFNLETIGINDNELEDMDALQAQEHFNKTVHYDEKQKRYQVSWPYKIKDPPLHDNKEICKQRLKSQVKRLEKDPKLFQRCDDIFKEQESKGIIEEVQPEDINNDSLKHWMPHSVVLKPNRLTTKERIVFQANCKKNRHALSLNDCLFTGPLILASLVGLLMNFRMKAIAVMGDIKQAFHQLKLNPLCRNVTLFYWLKNIHEAFSESNLKIMRFCRVPFGCSSSPFLLAASIKHHMSKYDTESAKQVTDGLYVDNIITTCDSASHAIKFHDETRSMFQEMSMDVRQWKSNNQTFMNHVSPENRVDSRTMSVLGMDWDTQTDTLSVKPFCINPLTHEDPLNPPHWTKRHVLSVIGSIFDPLGICTAVTLKGKIFLSKLWDLDLKWDTPLSSSLSDEWITILEDIKQCASITVPRYIGGESLQLVGFSDASAKSFSGVVYLVAKSGNSIRSNILYSRSRIKPKKGALTMPRLELLGLVIAARALKFASEQLHLNQQMFLFTDSKVCLHWLTTAKGQGAFVHNRIQELKRHTNITYCYVSSQDNPSDISTRSVSIDALKNDERLHNLWFHGPKWLLEDQKCWPKCEIPPLDQDTMQCIETEKCKKCDSIAYQMICLDHNNIESPFTIDAAKYSKLSKLIRVTAWCRRFIENCKKKKQNGPLSTIELLKAKNSWIQYIQEISFHEQLMSLAENRRNPLIQQLGLFLDEDKLIRCRGRLGNIAFQDNAKTPILLPRNHAVTKLLIMDTHCKLQHVGVSHTLSEIRRNYWIPKGRATVRHVLKSCYVCKRHTVGPYVLPDFPQFPIERVTSSPSFSYTGMDYCGPIFMKSDQNPKEPPIKCWIMLAVCLCSRSIHLELIPSLSSESFILAIRSFIAIRGKPVGMWSDNLSTYKLGEQVINEIWRKTITDPDVMSYVANQGITWHWAPEHSSWSSGHFERLVSNVKQSLKRTLGQLCLTQSHLRTTLNECMAVLNGRPLTFLGSEISDDGVILTPQHFLSLNQKTGCPTISDIDQLSDPDFVDKISAKSTLIENFKKGSAYLQQFWNLWHKNYVLSLRERYQKSHKQPRIHANIKPRPGDVVLIHEKNISRGSWKLGQIQSITVSHDGEVRSTKVKTPNKNILTRPLNELYPLECDIELRESKGDATSNSTQNGEQSTRPKRKAAVAALEKIKASSFLSVTRPVAKIMTNEV